MLTNGVSIVFSGTNDNYKGMSIAWASRVEREHLVVSLTSGSDATNMVLERGIFSINELRVQDENIARQFGGRNCRLEEPPAEIEVEQTKHNVPMLSNCCATAFCKVLRTHEINEQVVIIAKIIEKIEKSDMKPMIYEGFSYFSKNV